MLKRLPPRLSQREARVVGSRSRSASLSLSMGAARTKMRALTSLVLSREWGNGLLGLQKGTFRGYHRGSIPPFPTKNQGGTRATRHSLLCCSVEALLEELPLCMFDGKRCLSRAKPIR